MSTIKFTHFPRTQPTPDYVFGIIDVFRSHEETIATQDHATGLKSDEVLALLRNDLRKLGFDVESGKARQDRIVRPVFFGENGEPTKTYSVDAYWKEHLCGLEVEAGRAVGGNAIYRDLIQALVMVDLDSLCLAVPNVYRYRNTESMNYDYTIKVANALFGHSRVAMPYCLTVTGY
ncbi:MAG: hypothetical protein AAF663_02160 [Planctomycetota bacterium]